MIGFILIALVIYFVGEALMSAGQSKSSDTANTIGKIFGKICFIICFIMILLS